MPFKTLEALEEMLPSLPAAPTDAGRLAMIVSWSQPGTHVELDRARLTIAEGIPGDYWIRKEGATVDSQITVMQTGIARLIADGKPLWTFGDNLFVDLDMSFANLPIGSRVGLGTAVLEVTPKLHKGCRKFFGRFGVDALKFVATPVGRARRFRGVYLRVLEEGDIAPGDHMVVLERAALPEGAAV